MRKLTPLFDRLAGEIAVRSEERALYEAHYALLQNWNESMSLVSPKSLGSAFATHYLDSIHIVDFAAKYAKGPVADVGTGAGFPGLIHAIRFPDKPITLYEKSVKKQTFLMAAITQLGLTHVGLEGVFPDKPQRGLFLARAVLPWDALFKFFRSRLAPEAMVVVNLGGKGELKEAPKAFVKLDEKKYSLPLDCGERWVQLYQFVPRGTKT